MRDSKNKSSTKLNVAVEKTNTAKIPPSDFKVSTLENSLLSQQVVTSKGISVPYINL